MRGEHPQHGRLLVDLHDVGQGLEDIEVEERVARHRAVEPGLQEGRPVALKNPWGTAVVVLAHAGHSREHHLVWLKR